MIMAISDIINAWQNYLGSLDDWSDLLIGLTPKQTDCGPVYELENPIERPSESFALCDMREISITGPHYHTNGETEIYFVLEGTGTTYVGGKATKLKQGTVVATPPDTAHFTVSRGLFLAVVNTPPFDAANYVALAGSNPQVGFDQTQFTHLGANLPHSLK